MRFVISMEKALNGCCPARMGTGMAVLRWKLRAKRFEKTLYRN